MTVHATHDLTREYHRSVPPDWWLKRRTYFLFMLRELTALFVGAYAAFLLVLLTLGQRTFEAVLQSPISLVLHLLALPMVVYHSITWINLTPKVLVVWRGEEQVSPLLILLVHYAAWGVISLAILGLAVWFCGGQTP
jgi:fumarate reductase subunit C